MSQQQQFPVIRETTHHMTQKGVARTADGREALAFISPDGTADVYPLDDDEKKMLVSALTGGIEVAKEIPKGGHL